MGVSCGHVAEAYHGSHSGLDGHPQLGEDGCHCCGEDAQAAQINLHLRVKPAAPGHESGGPNTDKPLAALLLLHRLLQRRCGALQHINMYCCKAELPAWLFQVVLRCCRCGM